MTESPTVMKDITGYLEFEEAERFVEAAGNLRNKLIILLLWRCGLRVSEVVELRKKQIYFGEKVVAVFGKGRKSRRVPVEQNLLELLKIYTKDMELDNRLFRISRFAVFKIVRKLGEKVGIERVGEKTIHPHHFRHSFAIFMVRNGMPLTKLQTLLGHGSLSATTFYLQFKSKEISETYNKIWNKYNLKR
jgi:integrase/recombinase XerD